MNYGSIDNPTTKEAKLFAFLAENVGRKFTTIEIAAVIITACAHTYIHGVREQLKACPKRGYELRHEQRKRLHYYWLEPTKGQMELCA